jgi:3D (Asp-Asp-Asp) domain-containing protein
VLGQALPPSRRLVGVSLAAFCVLALPAVSGADRPHSTAGLEAENASLASRQRAATLDLYSLDTRLAEAQARLGQLERQAAGLRRQRVTLRAELNVALAGVRISQRQLASRVRLLFDHGDTSTLEILFGAKSLDEALTELDGLQQVASVNQDVLDQLRVAKSRIGRTSRALRSRTERLARATAAQAATTRALGSARASRAAYIADLQHQQDLNSRQIAVIEAEAQAAGARTQQLVAAAARTQQVVAPAAPEAAPAPAAAVPSAAAAPSAAPALALSGQGHTMTVSATAYSLPGRTASGLPVGWGVVAVDPSVIPLGTHLTIPGYGEAVAADTGSAVIGATIDIWFPTYAMAAAWGRKSITITLG